MAKSYATGFYASTAWKIARREYRKSVGGLCERCRAKGIYRPAEIVHHITHLTEDNITDASIALGFDNLMAVCRDCHAEIHAQDASGKRWTVDEDGRVSPLGEKKARR